MKNYQVGIILLLVLMNSALFAQKPPLLKETEEVMAAAIHELDISVKSADGKFNRYIAEKGITGTFTYNITLRGKGLVATVFALSDDGGNIKYQNQLKDLILSHRFNFRLPKGKLYKFQYTFNL